MFPVFEARMEAGALLRTSDRDDCGRSGGIGKALFCQMAIMLRVGWLAGLAGAWRRGLGLVSVYALALQLIAPDAFAVASHHAPVASILCSGTPVIAAALPARAIDPSNGGTPERDAHAAAACCCIAALGGFAIAGPVPVAEPIQPSLITSMGGAATLAAASGPHAARRRVAQPRAPPIDIAQAPVTRGEPAAVSGVMQCSGRCAGPTL